MRIRVIPAQMTTVEDTIAGNLTLPQLLLLLSAVMISAGTFAFFPPHMHISIYKIGIMGFLSILFSLLAIRIKGNILCTWFILFLTYLSRPTYYVYDKNDAAFRHLDIISFSKKRQLSFATILAQKKKQLTRLIRYIPVAILYSTSPLRTPFFSPLFKNTTKPKQLKGVFHVAS